MLPLLLLLVLLLLVLLVLMLLFCLLLPLRMLCGCAAASRRLDRLHRLTKHVAHLGERCAAAHREFLTPALALPMARRRVRYPVEAIAGDRGFALADGRRVRQLTPYRLFLRIRLVGRVRR